MKKLILKVVILMFLVEFVLPLRGISQVKELPSNLVIVNYHWFRMPSSLMEEVLTFNEVDNINLTEITHKANEEPLDSTSSPKTIEQYSIVKSQNGQTVVMSFLLPISENSNSNQWKDEFIYQLKITNTSKKTTKSLIWEYIFNDPTNGKELSRHTFYSEIRLKPNQTKRLEEKSIKPPTTIIPIGLLSGDVKNNYQELIEIKQISYSDGSQWKLP